MPPSDEIYCYVDQEYKQDIAPILECLRTTNNRVLVGSDLEEMLLLMQVGEPIAVLFTLANEGSTLSLPFQMLSQTAIENSTPIILVGPGEPTGNISLRLPSKNLSTKSNFDSRSIPFHILADELNTLTGLPLVRHGISDPFADQLVDTIGDDFGAIDIVTCATNNDSPRISTIVSRDGEVLVREELSIDEDDSQIISKMEDQHQEAVNSYKPAESVIAGKYHGEVSGPIVVPEDDAEKKYAGEHGFRRRRLVIASLMGVGAVAFAVVFVMLAALPSTPMPTELPRYDAPIVIEDLAIINTSTAQPAKVEDSLDAVPPPLSLTREDLSTAPAGIKIPFPASFQPDSTIFLIKDEWEEKRFLKMLKSLSSNEKIWIVGHVTAKEANTIGHSLGAGRAWSVAKYLNRNGISPLKISFARGDVINNYEDLDPNGRPRNRLVGIIIE